MDPIVHEILVNLGIPSSAAALIYFIIAQQIKKRDSDTEERKGKRDAELEILKNKVEANALSFAKHISHHQDFEKTICHKIDKLYDRLNPLCDAVNKIQGYMEARNDKSL